MLKSLALLGQTKSKWLALAPSHERAAYETAAGRVDDFIKFRGELVRLSRETGLREARTFGDNDGNRMNRTELNRALTGLVEADTKSVARLQNELGQYYLSRFNLLILLCTGGLVAGGVLATWYARRAVVKPLKDMIIAVTAVAAGKLEINIPAVGRRDEIGSLGQALLTFRDARPSA